MAGTDTSDPVLAIWGEVARSLPASWSAPIAEAVQRTGRVWRISLADGQVLALKIGVEGQPTAKEASILRWLERSTCPTPHVLASGGVAPGWMATEWCGDATLDDLAACVTGLGFGMGQELAAALLSVEKALAPLGDARKAREHASAALRAQFTPWLEEAPHAISWLLNRPLSEQETQAFTTVVNSALSCEPVTGSLDYHARNVVTGTDGMHLVDFPTVGFDWSERRLAQYALATGKGFASALDEGAVVSYAVSAASFRSIAPQEVAHRADAHDLLLIATAAVQLQIVDGGRAHPERAAAWHDVLPRRKQLRSLLTRRLSQDGPAEAFRGQLR
ncbi:MAG TPA: hypothetical protein VNM48_04815 [Chloroflexota bacterium]|nr:hypothetical protein [Chloroflexota bacterium]